MKHWHESEMTAEHGPKSTDVSFHAICKPDGEQGESMWRCESLSAVKIPKPHSRHLLHSVDINCAQEGSAMQHSDVLSVAHQHEYSYDVTIY